MASVDVVVEAACAVVPYLTQLLDDSAAATAADFSVALLMDPRPPDIADRLQRLFDRDERTREWLLAFLDDPAQLPPDLQGVRAATPPGTVPVSATRYRCPQAEHLVWYQQHVSIPVPACEVHGCPLVTP
jgi:hypothetical protein